MVSRGTPIQEPEWYLEVAGERTGPFTADQVMGLLSEGEIPAEQKVTSEQIGNRWITAAELATQAVAAAPGSADAVPSADPLDDLGFQPPPRPADLDRPGPVRDRPRQDAALNLFDALQTAKDRQGARWTPPEKGSWTSASRRPIRFPALGPILKKLKEIKITPDLRRQISFGTLAVIALLSVWGIVRLAWRSRPTPANPPVATAPAAPRPAPPPPQLPAVQAGVLPRGAPAAGQAARAPISDRDNAADRVDDRVQREKEEERAREIAERAVRDELDRYRDYRDRDEREPPDRDSRYRDLKDRDGSRGLEEYRVPPRGRTGLAAPPSTSHRGPADPVGGPGDSRSIVDPETEVHPVE